jgi:hypothetical protein
MSLNAKNAPSTGGGTKQDPIEAGPYPSRVVQVIDLGVQDQNAWDNKPKPPAHQMRLTYELVDEFCSKVDDDGNLTGEPDEEKPRWLSEDFVLYNLDADLATSTKRYRALDPEDKHDGDFPEVVGTPCMVTVTTKAGKGDKANVIYNNIGGVTPLRAKDAASCPALVNPPKVFLLDTPDMEVFGSLPDWLQDKIKKNHNFHGSVLEAAIAGKPVAQDTPKDSVADSSSTEANTGTDDTESQEESGDEVPW